jgi:tetratricopeptide (TPR) repeat protein
MKYSNTIISFLFVLLILSTAVQAEASDYLNEVVRANSLYSEKHYAQSAHAYEVLIEEGVRNGHLFYNLGNAYIRMGKTGSAIYNYLRATKLIPRDENLAANLKFAIQQTRDRIEPPPLGTLNILFFWVNDFSFNELVFFSIGLNFIFWSSLALWMYFPSLKLARNTLLFVLLLSFISIAVKIKNESDLKLGVVIAENIEVKSGHTVDTITLFQLHEGALVTITDKHNDWLEVRLNDRQKGWVPKNLLGT